MRGKVPKQSIILINPVKNNKLAFKWKFFKKFM